MLSVESFVSAILVLLLGFSTVPLAVVPPEPLCPQRERADPLDSTGESHGVPPYRYQGITPGDLAPPLQDIHPGWLGNFGPTACFVATYSSTSLSMRYKSPWGTPRNNAGDPAETLI